MSGADRPGEHDADGVGPDRDRERRNDDVSPADEQALTALFASLVADAEPSELSPLEVQRLAIAGRQRSDTRSARRRIARNVLLAAAVFAAALLVLPRLIQSSPSATATAGASRSSATVAAGSPTSAAPSAPFAAASATSAASASAAAGSGTGAAGAAGDAAGRAPVASGPASSAPVNGPDITEASSAASSGGAASTGSASSSAGSSAASAPASSAASSAAATPSAAGSSAAGATSGSVPAASTCPALPAGAAVAVRRALPATYRGSTVSVAGCAVVVSGSAGHPAIKLLVAPSAPGSCAGQSTCDRADGAGGYLGRSGAVPVVYVYGKGVVVTIHPTAGQPDSRQLIGLARALLTAVPAPSR